MASYYSLSMPAAQTTAAAARFTFAPGTLVHVLGPYMMDLKGRGTDAWTGMTMEVVEHYSNGDVELAREGDDVGVVSIFETRLIAD